MQALAPSHGGSGSVLREVGSVPSIDTKGLFAWLIGRSFLSQEVADPNLHRLPEDCSTLKGSHRVWGPVPVG